MSNKTKSKKQILKSSSIVGGASFITILIGLVKVKVLALLLGPAGIGLMGIFATVMAMGSTFFGMGLSRSGVRELALNNKNIEKLVLVRKALLSANILLGIFAVLMIVSYREALSELFFNKVDYQLPIVVIAVGVFFSLLSASQTALLQGLRKITELAKTKVLGALVAAATGLLVVWEFGESGIPFFIIIMPLATFIVAFYYCHQLPKATLPPITLNKLYPKWKSMFTLGFTFMLTGLMGVGCQLIVRYIINQKLNIESVGYFQAAWQISMTYISFVLAAMGADYYPRLTQKIHNTNEANQLVNEQTEIAIIFAAPVLLAVLAFSPLVINLLYSSEFSNSVEILRWQVFGDVLKVISWPLGFIIVAKGYSKLFFFTELLWNSSYIFLVYFGIEIFGIEITGYAFAASYLGYLLAVYVVSRRINTFQWSIYNIKLILTLIVASATLLLISYFSVLSCFILGFIMAAYATTHAIKTIAGLGIKNQKLNNILNIYQKIAAKLHF